MNPAVTLCSQPSLAVITGASGGLGSALARLLVERGWQVLGIDHNKARMAALAANLPSDSFHAIVSELQAPDMAQHMLEKLSGLAPPRGLVCAAAISTGACIDSLDDEAWELSLAVNTKPAMVLARAIAPAMAAAGGGAIVNVGSPVGIVGARKPSYAASKAALHGLTMSLARNLGARNVRANLFLPGPMITPLTEDWPEEKRASIARSSFLGRLCEPMEAARVIAFLISDEASYITGSVIDSTAGSMFGH
jgi:NAD(P)-dependent dehydrogenase (short-subunit alcohol dehydrogenase family)